MGCGCVWGGWGVGATYRGCKLGKVEKSGKIITERGEVLINGNPEKKK